MSTDPPNRSAPRMNWLTVATISVALFMVTLDNLIVTVGLPTIRADLQASIEELEWTVNAYTLAFAVALIPAAALGDRFGRKRTFIAGLALFTAASAAAAIAPTAEMLITARMVQGVGGAIIAPLTLTLLAAGVPKERRGIALGIWSAISGVAVAMGPLVGGAVIEVASWHWMFWINVPIGLLLIPAVVRQIKESYGERAPLDLPGLALIAAGLTGVVFGLIRGNADGWTSPLIVGSIATGVAGLAAFVWWERRTLAPMVPLSLFRNRGFVVTNLVGFFMMFGTFGSIFLLSQQMQLVFGYGALDTGLRMLVWTGATLAVAPFAGPLAERYGPRYFMAAGLALQATALIWIALVSEQGMSWIALIGPFVAAGVGMALSFAPAASAVLASVRPERAGQASGVNNAVRETGAVFGVAVLATVFSANGNFDSPQAFLDGTFPAVIVGACITGFGALVALLYRREPADNAAKTNERTPELAGQPG